MSDAARRAKHKKYMGSKVEEENSKEKEITGKIAKKKSDVRKKEVLSHLSLYRCGVRSKKQKKNTR